MKSRKATLVLILVFIAGLSLLLYPTISNYWNSLRQSRVIADYAQTVAELNDESQGHMLAEAQTYNSELAESGDRYELSEEDYSLYEGMLNISGSGVMGYIEIPSINVTLPVRHGVDAEVLQGSVGHLPGSSLPVGGESTHCVLSGHRGLPSARLFTDLDRLEIGDIFILTVLDMRLVYEVDQIRIVGLSDTELLEIEQGQDFCTLVTCTPYGVNSHRLLVRGHRTDASGTAYVHITADAVQVNTLTAVSLTAVPILTALMLWMLIRAKKKNNSRDS